jgi:hypothetical protein
MPPTHVCKYVPAPGGAIGYKVKLFADVYARRHAAS